MELIKVRRSSLHGLVTLVSRSADKKMEIFQSTYMHTIYNKVSANRESG